MSTEKSASANAVARHRERKASAGLARVEVWVPEQLVEQARRVVAELIERHKGRGSDRDRN